MNGEHKEEIRGGKIGELVAHSGKRLACLGGVWREAERCDVPCCAPSSTLPRSGLRVPLPHRPALFASLADPAAGAWRSWLLPTEKSREFLRRPWIKSSLYAILLFSFAFVPYIAFFSGHWGFPVCTFCKLAADSAPPPSTNISHILFGMAGSAHTWKWRRRYSELWWRPGQTRGYIWLDEEPPEGGAAWPTTCPPYRVSENTSRFGKRASAARIARIVADTYSNLVDSGEEGVKWLVMGDDDTVFFPENLVTVLGKYDHEHMWYVGGISESVDQDLAHSYGTAFGGGGFAISLPAAAELARVLDGCLERYNHFYGSDERIHACLSELGVPLTREPGFHQVDMRGDTFGMLAAHPVAPLVSLHHLDHVSPISPRGQNRLEALGSLVQASRFDPARTLQQTICYDLSLNLSISVSWGYSAQVYPLVLTPTVLETPFRTFRTWRGSHSAPFTFNTRPMPSDACKQPVVYFLDQVRKHDGGGSPGTVTEYAKYVRDEGKAVCDRSEFIAASNVRTVKVFAPKMDPDDWKKAPRRQCCETEIRQPWWGTATTMDVRIRKCRPGETLLNAVTLSAPPPPQPVKFSSFNKNRLARVNYLFM